MKNIPQFAFESVCSEGFSHLIREENNNLKLFVFCVGCKKLVYDGLLKEDTIQQNMEIISIEKKHYCNKRSIALKIAQKIRESYIRIRV